MLFRSNGASLRTGINNNEIPKNFFSFFNSFGYDNYSVFKSPRQLSYQGAKIFNPSTVSSLYKKLTNVDLLQGQFNTTNDSTVLYKFPTNVYKQTSTGPSLDSNPEILGKGSWTQQDFIKHMDEFMKAELEKYTFRPLGPDGRFEWLNTINIDEVMNQYEMNIKDFSF